ncbi:DUF1659 domain-containing protein [Dehalobacter sp.]|uniref:DUF1659 domain-containing protein n=1 Tax=Dehalobacter sp. TaxID=1962289 RepID=UPI002590AB2F|nr:DUF1659 domain-containing protein [Dehalobacter sp.]MCG1024382.1 DUF1659 domain-containing protein [Dehalobacter sp.]
MAAIAVSLNSILAARYQTGGTTPAGDPEIKKKGINYVKPDAAVQDLFDVITALYGLSQNPVANVLLQKNYELIDEE